MRNISDIIEQFIKDLIKTSETGEIEIQRSELAEKFQCVPSQINYVLNTRFSLEKGFVVESKRGGGGYIRIKKINIPTEQTFYEIIMKAIGEEISQSTAYDLISRLLDEELLNQEEFLLFKSILSREVLDLPLPIRDQIRANILKTLIKVIFSR
ncbi:CtsR family transcriptional regulator [Tepidibacillus fermentans]|uniref:Transcriptional regulator CtsR n=1 Tax=Tepidibacillus fermentans TaxID=1281767 RepID=A0A4R3KEY7_9BACI|nr:CtsR family transcriptional regulator [Tepidibacillus fermentans]TCS81583.1 transcriptional regulator CtsR [Tepidibacillus fermentans]